jgi:hypothetical protein
MLKKYSLDIMVLNLKVPIQLEIDLTLALIELYSYFFWVVVPIEKKPEMRLIIPNGKRDLDLKNH